MTTTLSLISSYPFLFLFLISSFEVTFILFKIEPNGRPKEFLPIAVSYFPCIVWALLGYFTKFNTKNRPAVASNYMLCMTLSGLIIILGFTVSMYFLLWWFSFQLLWGLLGIIYLLYLMALGIGYHA